MVVGAGSTGPGWSNGKAAAIQFAREGASVFCVDVNGEAAEETVHIIREEGYSAEAFTADAGNAEDVEATVAACVSRMGGIHVLHHNVGIAALGGPVQQSLQDWERVMSVNLTSLFLLCKHALPIMEKQGKGVITAVGSLAANCWSGTSYVSYSASKAGMIALIRSIALEYASKGIRANTILPGYMDTPTIYASLADKANIERAEFRNRRNAICPTGRMGDAWDVARAAAFLASDDAHYITGTSLTVDGGLSQSIPV